MKRLFGKLLAAVMGLGLVAGGAMASGGPANKPAKLIVEDNGKMFSDSAIEKAKKEIADVHGDQVREVHIETYSKLNDEQDKAYKALKEKNDKEGLNAFWKEWAKAKIVGDKGVVVMINRAPGHLEVRVDRQITNEGFTLANEKKVGEILFSSFEAAGKKATEVEKQGERDAGLLQVAKYIAANLPTKGLKGNAANINQVNHRPAHAAGEGSGIMSWVCIGLSVMLGIWLITGLFRAFSGGGGGGGYGPGGGGGGYGGGGGGGFMSGMLGGLFGAVAGNYLYNNMFGGSSSSYAGDNGSSSYGDGGTSTDGAGDFSDGGTGGDFGGDTGGGGDWGGGGDAGGGDFGGGGGDW